MILAYTKEYTSKKGGRWLIESERDGDMFAHGKYDIARRYEGDVLSGVGLRVMRDIKDAAKLAHPYQILYESRVLAVINYSPDYYDIYFVIEQADKICPPGTRMALIAVPMDMPDEDAQNILFGYEVRQEIVESPEYPSGGKIRRPPPFEID